ncbi:hypothetical protein GGR52DRAFT_211309 [Hypoxylon sp. FL1284]|nr:hypothetical protein GGR52DRAFT_211309 [Hypoxylon sp. FL1284]
MVALLGLAVEKKEVGDIGLALDVECFGRRKKGGKGFERKKQKEKRNWAGKCYYSSHFLFISLSPLIKEPYQHGRDVSCTTFARQWDRSTRAPQEKGGERRDCDKGGRFECHFIIACVRVCRHIHGRLYLVRQGHCLVPIVTFYFSCIASQRQSDAGSNGQVVEGSRRNGAREQTSTSTSHLKKIRRKKNCSLDLCQSTVYSFPNSVSYSSSGRTTIFPSLRGRLCSL